MDDEIETMGDSPEVETQTSPDAPTASAGAAVSVAQPAAPASQPQGPDWNQLGVPFDQAQQRLNYFNELEQRYKSDPAWAQQYDKLYGGQQQQAAPHAYDWMMDEKAMAERREKGEAHPDHGRLTQEFTNFFHNQPGHLAQLANHPKVAEASFQAQAPMIQDLVQRMIHQAVNPINEHFHRQGQQQFQQQYGKAFESIPKPIMDLYKAGRFGQGQQGIIGAVEAAKVWGQQQAAAGAEALEPEAPKAPEVNKNNASTKTPTAPVQQGIGRKKDPELEAAAREWGASQGKK